MMGSGNTKRKKKLEQDEQEEVKAKAKGKPHKSEEDIDQHSIKNSNPKKQEEVRTKTTQDGPLKTERTKSPTSRQSAELVDDNTLSSFKDSGRNESEITVLDEKPVSKTLESTKLALSARGYSDEKLIEHSDKTPRLKETFISLYDSLKQLKKGLGKEEYYSNSRPIRNISDSYSRQKEPASKIALGDLLADIGFAVVVKDALLKLEADFPNILSYDRETGTKSNFEELTSGGIKLSSDSSDSTEVKKAQDFLSIIMLAAINYTDLSDAMNLAFNEAGLVQILVAAVEKLKDCTKDHLMFLDASGTLTEKTTRGTILSRLLGTLHNLSKRIPTRANFQACNAVKVVLPMIDDKVPIYATKALLLLAYLIDEGNNNLIMANKAPIKYLVSLIDKASQSLKRRYMGFSNSELAEGLAQIAINDANKKQIVANGAIPVLARMIKGAKSEEEEIAAAEALWQLAFDDENKEKMQNNEMCMEMLYKLKESKNDRGKKAASGALWEIEGKKQHSSHLEEKKKHSSHLEGKKKQSSHSTDTAAAQAGKPSAATDDATSAATGSATTNHVMISYQWDVQKTLIQVKDRLQAAGFRVWMDLEQMGGSTLEAMAKAVENSTVVLVCVSQKYKESSNCRSEAEYAFQLHKDIIPLMMDRNYKPDGWLGMIMGSKLWIDFSQRHARLDSSMRDLQKELGDRGKGNAEIVQVSSVDVVDAIPIRDISGWTNDDVMNWMKGFGLVIKKKNPRVSDKLNGPLLTRLHSLRNESPEFYYSALKDDIGLSDVFDVLLFTDELEKLVG